MIKTKKSKPDSRKLYSRKLYSGVGDSKDGTGRLYVEKDGFGKYVAFYLNKKVAEKVYGKGNLVTVRFVK